MVSKGSNGAQIYMWRDRARTPVVIFNQRLSTGRVRYRLHFRSKISLTFLSPSACLVGVEQEPHMAVVVGGGCSGPCSAYTMAAELHTVNCADF